MPMNIRLVCALFTWYISSVMVNVTWKWAVKTYSSVLLLTMVQFAISEIIALSTYLSNNYYNIRYKNDKTFSKKEGPGHFRLITSIGLTFALGQLCTNSSLSMSSVALTNAIKATEPFVALIFSFLFFQADIPSRAMFYMLLTIVGACLTSKSDSSFSVNGALYATASNFFLQARNVLIKNVDKDETNSRGIRLFLYSNTVGLMFLAIACIIYSIINGFDLENIFFVDNAMVLAGIFFALQHISSYIVLEFASTTTHALLNVSKRVFIIFVGSVILGTVLTNKQIVGICITFISLYYLAY